ncbi:MAG: FIST C-terminal domain-containing protein [Alphaproteobacteria bacterium]|nr:FIST C-terminal domain-containing protein [Alphaproteobacteria bacterium]
MSSHLVPKFSSAFAKGDPATLAARCLSQMPGDTLATVGVVYVSEAAAAALPDIVRELSEGTGIADWVGGVGLGICAGANEVYEASAAAVLTASLPADAFRLFAASNDPGAELPRHHSEWLERVSPSLALVHGDARCDNLMRVMADTAAASGAFLVGGLVSHRCEAPLLAGDVANETAFGRSGMSGLMLSPEIGVATGLTQGCVPIGPVHRIDEARENIIMEIDGRPALNVFYDDIGPELVSDPRRLGGIIFAGLPVAGTDTGDYLVRNLMAIDPRQGWVVIGAEVSAGDPIVFCRRDPESARADMDRMLKQLSARLPGPPRAGIYVSCIARGASLFGEPGVETGMIREALGDFPLIGFFANGEISRDRLYGHTGVLTLFT